MNKKQKTWLVKGDCHADFSWLDYHFVQVFEPDELAIIILGDAGFNVGQGKQVSLKEQVNKSGIDIYCVRGNHEIAPYNMPGMEKVWDETVSGYVYLEKEFPHIKYFKDYGVYWLKDTSGQEFKTLVIGGAYSVDKYWRLKMNHFWYPLEQLTEAQRADCDRMIDEMPDKHFNFVLTHTCPMDMQPVDKFLSMVDQSTVDNTMEKWLSTVEERITFDRWLSGHFHVDRLVDSHHILYYNCIDELAWLYETDVIARG